MAAWIKFLLIFTIIERSYTFEETVKDPPLAKSLGYSLRKLDSKTLEDAEFNREFMQQYEEMLRASRGSFDNANGKEDKRWRRVVGHQNNEMTKEGILDHHNSPVLEPTLDKQRVWTQAMRRQKLDHQGERSNIYYVRENIYEED